MWIFKPGICPLRLTPPPHPPPSNPSTAALPSQGCNLSLPAQTHISEKTLAAVPGAEGHVSGIQAGFFVGFGLFFFFISELAGKAEREPASSATRQLAGITCLKKKGGVGGDFGGAASRAVGVLRFAEQVADLSLLHSSHPDVPCLDYLT